MYNFSFFNSKGVTIFQRYNAILHIMLNLWFQSFKSIFLMHFLSVATFFLYLFLYNCSSWYLHFIDMLVLIFYHLTLGDKSAKILGLHIWSHLPKNLKAKSSFQMSNRYLNDWFEPKWISSLKVSKDEE